ncbi:MAG TPA: beta-propeller domain-containing protein [Steroidobacteraceae bacterium]|jgi:hypothetical protein|nr:beta-propeller domain-containing protein [Steroidobacteraceae bacterium]
MRRALNWFVVLLSFASLFASLALSGCGSGGGKQEEPPPAVPSGMLREVRDADELERLLKAALTKAVVEQVLLGPVDVPTASAADFSSTYTVEPGVDELDYVRFDGSYLYVGPPYFDGPDLDGIRILRTDLSGATATEVARIPVDDDVYGVAGMYVSDGRLFLVTTEAYFGNFGRGGIWPAFVMWAPTRLHVRVYDVRDPAHPSSIMSSTIEGVLVSSRRVGDRVVLVTRHAPAMLLDEEKRQHIDRLSLAELMPSITVDGGVKRPLVDPRNCFVTSGRETGYAVITTITTISMANPLDIDGVCYDEATSGAYASDDAVYLSEPRLELLPGETTRIHKFSIATARPAYQGSADIPGMLFGSGQDDFRLSESGDVLRVMTSRSTGDAADNVDHQLFMLRKKAGERALEIVGRLPNDARPEEIGKPDESLFAVRFAGNRAYAVTFRRVDPLYVIDLSNPADPFIGGQLQLPGFSELLHPVTDDLLLGLGSDGSRFKLELFDTSVLAQPQSRGVITLGTVTSNSPVLYDRHALAYLPGTDSDRLAVPAAISTPDPAQGYVWTTGLHQFEIQGKQSAASASLLAAGVVSPVNPDDSIASLQRSFIIGDTVYYIRDGNVYGTSWPTPSQVNGPF